MGCREGTLKESTEMRIRLLPEAERDLEIGAHFYESQQPGLGIYFNDCLTADIESLRFYAGIYETYRGFQRSLSKRFPFSIYYILNEDCVDIYAILDARQDPETIYAILESPRTNR
jgi:plasmid stabilization system protein ParE